MNISDQETLSIRAVERETGISKDVLRKWESRYGFPAPLRDAQGERSYPADQVDRLRLIKRLMDTGLRPSRIVAESAENLHALILAKPPVEASASIARMRDLTLEMLRHEDPAGLRRRLQREMLSRGVEGFVQDVITPLNHAVGEAWARGGIDIHEEHVYTEVVQGLLRDVVAQLADTRARPRVLLTTLPEEEHGIGLLMVAALLSLRGAYCVSLGTQTPVQDIAQAARAYNANVVALSFSIAYPHRRIAPALAELRQRLDEETELWAGGAGCARVSVALPGVRLCPGMQETLDALDAWRVAKVEPAA
jgi:methanogenic corrinoid protein MtbC1